MFLYTLYIFKLLSIISYYNYIYTYKLFVPIKTITSYRLHCMLHLFSTYSKHKITLASRINLCMLYRGSNTFTQDTEQNTQGTVYLKI